MNGRPDARTEFRVVSDTKGRLRIRVLGRPRARRESVRRLVGKLGERTPVTSFHANPSTGSVTLLYDGDAYRSSDIIEILIDAGMAHERTDGVRIRLEPAGASDIAISTLDAVTELDARLSRLMGRRIDLKVAVPLTLLALAVWKTATQGTGWKQMPAYQLLWYACATFRELNVELALKEMLREPPDSD